MRKISSRLLLNRIIVILFFVVFLSVPSQLLSSIVVFEGMSGAGKSSTIIALYPQLSKNFFVLPELNPELSSEFKNKSLLEQIQDYYHLWVKRMEIVKQSKVDFIFDRSYFGSLAFSYAIDRLQGTNYYPPLLNQMRSSFDFQTDFDRILVLDVDPSVSIKRRKTGGMDNYWPWNTTDFLKYFRDFYLLELPKLTKIDIEYINTTNLFPSQVKTIILNKLGITETIETTSFSQIQKDLLVDYIETHCLGFLHSSPISLFGYPSIITETTCLQLDEKNHPIVLDNERLKYLLNTHETSLTSKSKEE